MGHMTYSAKDNLCDYCVFEFPTCKAKNAKFGHAIGNDNVVSCETMHIEPEKIPDAINKVKYFNPTRKSNKGRFGNLLLASRIAAAIGVSMLIISIINYVFSL